MRINLHELDACNVEVIGVS